MSSERPKQMGKVVPSIFAGRSMLRPYGEKPGANSMRGHMRDAECCAVANRRRVVLEMHYTTHNAARKLLLIGHLPDVRLSAKPRKL